MNTQVSKLLQERDKCPKYNENDPQILFFTDVPSDFFTTAIVPLCIEIPWLKRSHSYSTTILRSNASWLALMPLLKSFENASARPFPASFSLLICQSNPVICAVSQKCRLDKVVFFRRINFYQLGTTVETFQFCDVPTLSICGKVIA